MTRVVDFRGWSSWLGRLGGKAKVKVKVKVKVKDRAL
jgi:hypothetical protein